jgi:hypothetical protein
MGWAYSIHGGDEKHIKILVGKPEEKIPLGTPRHGWKCSIKMDLKETG